MRVFILCALCLAASTLQAQSFHIPAPPQARPIVLVNATIHTVSGPTLQNASLRFADGLIEAVGAEVSRADAEVIDLQGRHVYPGIIAANSALGLVEIPAVRATVDDVEVGPINPNVRAQVAMNPDSDLIPVARADGVLGALIVPGAGQGGIVAGLSAFAQLDGWTWEDLTLAAPVAMHVYWPGQNFPPWLPPALIQQAREAARQQIAALERAIVDARAYQRARDAQALERVDLRWEAMAPVLRGELPVFFHADTVSQMREALAFARREDLRAVIVGGQEAARMIDELRAARVAVILTGTHRLPLHRWEAYDAPFTVAAELHAAGIPFAIAGPGGARGSSNERTLAFQAATAVAHGLPREEAIRAITLYPARILGIGDRLGSIEPGKLATLIVVDGDPLDIRSTVERAWIGGREIDLSSRHTRLYDKFREKYRQLELLPQ